MNKQAEKPDPFGRIEKTWKDLDWDAVNFESSSVSNKPGAGQWAWGCGGLPHRDDEYSISHVDEKLVDTVQNACAYQ